MVTCRLLHLIAFDLFSFDLAAKIGNLFPSEASERRGRFISPPELMEPSRVRLLCAGFKKLRALRRHFLGSRWLAVRAIAARLAEGCGRAAAADWIRWGHAPVWASWWTDES